MLTPRRKLLTKTVLGEITTEGELLFEDMEAPIVGKALIHCSFVAEGTLGPAGSDLIEELFGLKGEPVNDLTCEALEGCETSAITPPFNGTGQPTMDNATGISRNHGEGFNYIWSRR